ncbi:Crp/Fnr family transcriptional regulator [Fulvimarina sp. 2208YS6-2-32]|uniref:Crp/Fnr family transcriptional regulator n=1 Tax=Fulvimarina uroteuthidis TaxID=3098149 RepID=A0ABU5I384_9HYPH|nr:Crp/Fnr family transcriptional regulator [Fulvimarina sp. 2208YS6-2-32]MDY8109831.1 Crp/Fnr family transcriptional regulator [Fulvimarina sp. 2208YS6-2-32]
MSTDRTRTDPLTGAVRSGADAQDGRRLDIHNSDIPLLCRACEARHKGICGGLDPDQLQRLSRHTHKHVLRENVEVIAPQQPVTTYSNILSGVVKLTKLMPDGRQQIVSLQFAPDFLGRPFKASNEYSAEAATDIRVCSFPRKVLEDMIDESPDLGRRLYEQSLKELDEARDWMLTLGRRTAAEKVASFLYLIATHIDPEVDLVHGGIRFDLPLKRADIADFLGLTIETVSRQLTKLRKANIIEIEMNRTVIVPNVERLKAACAAS